MEKEFLYVGHYIDTDGNYILKIGTTNDLRRRATEHTRHYRKAKEYRLPATANFEYDFSVRLSKYNTLRYEDRNRRAWQENGVGEFVRNDRFNCGNRKPRTVNIKIRKVYEVALQKQGGFSFGRLASGEPSRVSRLIQEWGILRKNLEKPLVFDFS